MENVKDGPVGAKSNDENPNSVVQAENEVETNLAPSQQPSRTPFTSLSQVDADLALARRLQEQERAYMMLRMNGNVSDYGSSNSGSYAYEDDVADDDDDDDVDAPNNDENSEVDDADEEDAFDVHAHAEGEDNDQAAEHDPSAFESDEAYARYLQEVEEREMAMRLMAFAGLNDFPGEAEDDVDHDSNSQQDWEEVDPDELSYEELLALGEVVGTESRGLSSDTIAALPSISYKAQDQDEGTEQCVICRLEFDDGETLTALSCKHSYHPECINNWLQINKVCPVCSTEVSTSENSSNG